MLFDGLSGGMGIVCVLASKKISCSWPDDPGVVIAAQTKKESPAFYNNAFR